MTNIIKNSVNRYSTKRDKSTATNALVDHASRGALRRLCRKKEEGKIQGVHQ